MATFGRRFAPALIAGVLGGLLTAIFQLSFASLIFAGDLEPFVSRGISMLLLGTTVSLVISALFRLMPESALMPQDTPVALMAAMAANVATATAGPMPADEAFHTVVAAMMVTTLAAALVFLLVARLGLARFIRIMPYPVIGGFLAGVGWLIVQGGITMMAGFWPTLQQLELFFSAPVLLRWLPGLLFGVAVMLISRRVRHMLVLPAAVVLGAALFYAILAASGSDLSEATAQGWLLGRFRGQRLWIPFSFELFQATRWSVVLDQAPTLMTAVVVCVLASVLNIGSIEALAGRSSDARRELTAVAAANFGGFFVGGAISYHTVSFAGLMTTMRVKSRAVPLVAALVCGAAALAGASTLSFLPKPVLGGIIVVVGAGFLTDWLYDGWRRLSRADYLIGLGMVAVVAFFGLLPAVGAGIVASVALFAAKYARAEAVTQEASGGEIGSSVERSESRAELLRDRGDEIRLFKLRGYIFFGTAYTVFERIRARLDDAARVQPRYVVLDLRRVSGIDGSAEMLFRRMLAFAAARDCSVVLCSVGAPIKRQLEGRGGQLGELELFDDIDHALEWCEDDILRRCGLAAEPEPGSLRDLLAGLLRSAVLADRLLPLLERHEVPAGGRLIGEGEAAERLYVLQSGQLAVFLRQKEGPPTRLRTMRAGAIFGEAEIYLGRPRTATIIARRSSVCYSISAADLHELESHDPELAFAVQRFMVRLLSERLIDLTRTIRALSD